MGIPKVETSITHSKEEKLSTVKRGLKVETTVSHLRVVL